MDNFVNIISGLMMTGIGLLALGTVVVTAFKALTGQPTGFGGSQGVETLKILAMILACGLGFLWGGVTMLKHYKEYRTPNEW